MILDLFEELFRPAVDMGLVEPGTLRGFRTGAVGLSGWRHIPPNAMKIRDLLGGLERFAADTNIAPVTRAIVVHLEFVTIHPFLDGNGRLARLLFNLQLLRAGLPWLTVRNDEKIPFFRAIEAAQVDGQTEPYARFMRHAIESAKRDLEAMPTSRRGGARP
jgi:Fic family protein